MDADCSLGDGVKELVYVYKQLYHAAVERCGIHQDQLEQYSELLPKVKKIAELHVSTVYSTTVTVFYSCYCSSQDTYQIQRADKSKKKLDEVTLREDQWKQVLINIYATCSQAGWLCPVYSECLLEYPFMGTGYIHKYPVYGNWVGIYTKYIKYPVYGNWVYTQVPCLWELGGYVHFYCMYCVLGTLVIVVDCLPYHSGNSYLPC